MGGRAQWGHNVGNLVFMSDLLSTVFLARIFSVVVRHCEINKAESRHVIYLDVSG